MFGGGVDFEYWTAVHPNLKGKVMAIKFDTTNNMVKSFVDTSNTFIWRGEGTVPFSFYVKVNDGGWSNPLQINLLYGLGRKEELTTTDFGREGSGLGVSLDEVTFLPVIQ